MFYDSLAILLMLLVQYNSGDTYQREQKARQGLKLVACYIWFEEQIQDKD